jgi:hypothetical protein
MALLFMNEQLQLPYPVGDLILYPVLTKEAIKKYKLNEFSLTDFILRDCDVDYEKGR